MSEENNNATDTAEMISTGDLPGNPVDLGGLVSAVEGKMSELMRWHSQRVSALDAAKAEHEQKATDERAELTDQREKLTHDRDTLTCQMEGLERERERLLGLAQKLEAEQDALAREWKAVHHARELNEKVAAELNQERQRVNERAGSWLSEAVTTLDQPLRLATEGLPSDADGENESKQAA